MGIMDKLMKAGSVKGAGILSESVFFTEKDSTPTHIPILNIALSGSLTGGLESGLTTVAGPSKHFKSNIGLVLAKAYLDKYADGICLFLDSEFGITKEYIASVGIDPARVLHVPIEHIEMMKFDLVKRLDAVERGDHVVILIDSIGNTSSKKELDDALDEKAVADMTRAKSLKSFFRIITPHLTTKDIPCIAINHTYQELALFPRQIVGGGTGGTYSSNTIFIIGRQQEKDSAGEIEGWNFILNVEKSRKVKEKSKLSFLVTYEGGIAKYSGMLELALESKHVVAPTKGWYQRMDPETGEALTGKLRAKDLTTAEFWDPVLKDPVFQQFVERKFKVSYNAMNQSEAAMPALVGDVEED